MNAEQAAAPTTREDVVNPPSRLPAERSTSSLGNEARQGAAGDRVNERAAHTSSRSASAVLSEIHAEDFCSHPIPGSDPDELWPPMKEYPDSRGPEWGRDAGDNLERVLRFRKQRP